MEKKKSEYAQIVSEIYKRRLKNYPRRFIVIKGKSDLAQVSN